MISPVLCNVYLHRLDRQWTQRGHGVLVRYADDLLAICKTKREAESALEAFTAILDELGLELKPTKTRIVHRCQPFRFASSLPEVAGRWACCPHNRDGTG